MNISNYYWYFKWCSLTPKFCDEVIKYANESKRSYG